MRLRLLPPDKEIGWTPYVWLIWLGFFFIQPVFGRAGWKEWLATALGSVLSWSSISRGTGCRAAGVYG